MKFRLYVDSMTTAMPGWPEESRRVELAGLPLVEAPEFVAVNRAGVPRRYQFVRLSFDSLTKEAAAAFLGQFGDEWLLTLERVAKR